MKYTQHTINALLSVGNMHEHGVVLLTAAPCEQQTPAFA
jgi:hypothetical protein